MAIAAAPIGFGRALNISPDIMRTQLTVTGSWTFTSAIRADCTRFVAAHSVDVDKLFFDRWRLDQAGEAYRVIDTQSAGKRVFVT